MVELGTWHEVSTALESIVVDLSSFAGRNVTFYLTCAMVQQQRTTVVCGEPIIYRP
jgi:hypothetical protein